MLPVVDPDGSQTGRTWSCYCLALFRGESAAVSSAGRRVYVAGALVMGVVFLHLRGILPRDFDAGARGLFARHCCTCPPCWRALG